MNPEKLIMNYHFNMKALIQDKFTPYNKKRKGLFRVDAGFYDIVHGVWQTKTEELTIIGETDDIYVQRLYESEFSDRKLSNYGKKYTGTIGPHKSRLIKWVVTQTELLFY